ncbi:hypothetical protein GCM10009611_19370 [Arthrobacter roseus]
MGLSRPVSTLPFQSHAHLLLQAHTHKQADRIYVQLIPSE